MQPKRDAKVKTILHRHAPLLCHIQGQSLQKTGFVLNQHWYHVKRLRVSKTETHWERHTHTKKKESIWTSTSTLISMIHQIITLAMWGGHCKGEALRSGALMTVSPVVFPELSRLLGWGERRRFQIGFIWFPRTHFGFSGAYWKRSHLSKHYLETGIGSVSHTLPALVNPCWVSSAQNEIHHHLRSRA